MPRARAAETEETRQRPVPETLLGKLDEIAATWGTDTRAKPNFFFPLQVADVIRVY
jgi:hypothetical protein